MTGHVVAFRAPGDPPVTTPVKFPDKPWPNRPPGTKKSGLRSQVVPFVPRPKLPARPAHVVARHLGLIREFARECGYEVSFPAYPRSHGGDGA